MPGLRAWCKNFIQAGTSKVPAFFSYIWVVFSACRMKETWSWHRLLFVLVGVGTGSLVTTPLRAQCPNTIPKVSEYGTGSYSVRQVGSSCLPLTVNVKNTLPGSTNVLTLFDYKGGLINPDSLKTDTLHTYTRPGKYTIVQFSEQAERKLIACPTVYVYDTLPPRVRLVSCGSNQVKLFFEESSTTHYDSYWISWNDGNIQEISVYTRTVSHVFTSPAPRTITVWGTVNPGLCRSRDVILKIDPASHDQLPVITDISVQGTSVAELTLTNSQRSELLVERKSTTGLWESTGRTVKKEYEKIRVTVDSLDPTCFRLQATDTCLVRYTSEPVCSPVFQTTSSGQATAISWRASDLPPLARVVLVKDGNFWKDISAQAASGTFEDEGLPCGSEHCYQLLVSSPTLRIASRTLCQTTPTSLCDEATSLFIPDAFSPNGDGINDFLEVKGEGTLPLELSIFSPWGTLLFHTTTLQPSWDGKFQNAGVPAGVYIYLLTTGEPGSKSRFTRRGKVVVIK